MYKVWGLAYFVLLISSSFHSRVLQWSVPRSRELENLVSWIDLYLTLHALAWVTASYRSCLLSSLFAFCSVSLSPSSSSLPFSFSLILIVFPLLLLSSFLSPSFFFLVHSLSFVPLLHPSPPSVRVNPYCEVIVDGQKSGNLRTESVRRSDTPEWDEEFTLYVWGRGWGLIRCSDTPEWNDEFAVYVWERGWGLEWSSSPPHAVCWLLPVTHSY